VVVLADEHQYYSGIETLEMDGGGINTTSGGLNPLVLHLREEKRRRGKGKCTADFYIASGLPRSGMI